MPARTLLLLRMIYNTKRSWDKQSESVKPILTELYRNWISSDLDVFPPWCRHFQFLGFLSGTLTTDFCTSRSKCRDLTLFRATKNSVVICWASFLYEFGNQFRSTWFVHTIFPNCFRLICNLYQDRSGAFSTCLVNDVMEQTCKPWTFLIADM